MRNNAIGTKEYWNNRVKKAPNREDMLFIDDRRRQYWGRVREFLQQYRDATVADICCGFGHFADIFADDKYYGYDVSDEMLKIACEEHPGKSFTDADFITGDTELPNVDVVFEVNSLHSLGKTPDEFYEQFGKYAPIILCLECDKFTIYENGAKREIEQTYRR